MEILGCRDKAENREAPGNRDKKVRPPVDSLHGHATVLWLSPRNTDTTGFTKVFLGSRSIRRDCTINPAARKVHLRNRIVPAAAPLRSLRVAAATLEEPGFPEKSVRAGERSQVPPIRYRISRKTLESRCSDARSDSNG